jgi:predicted transcriptional regulator
MAEKEKVVGVRIPIESIKALERAAEANDRTLSAELRRAVRHYLAGPEGAESANGKKPK